MGLKTDLSTSVASIFRERWVESDAREVPEATMIKLGSNHAKKLAGTVLYADIAESTALVDRCTPQFAAEIYKSYLLCAARIVKAHDGVVTAYDGDRIMAVFIGDTPNSNAAKSALKLNYAVIRIINPAIATEYGDTTFKLAHRVGIDSSDLFVARTGVRNDNDLVWVGRAANHAAKLCAIKEDNTSFISEAVYSKLSDEAKFSSDNRRPMWEPRQWNDQSIYRSTWTWEI